MEQGKFLSEDVFSEGFVKSLNEQDSSVELFNTDDLLGSIHYSLLMENIYDQMRELRVNHVNFVTQYEERYGLIYARYKETEDMPALMAARQETYLNIIKSISEKYGIHMMDDVDAGYVPMIGICLYDFYVFNLYNNMVTFFTNIIMTNKKSLVMDFKNVPVNSNNATKKVLKDKNDIHLFNNLYKIITEYIPSMDIGQEYLTYVLPYYNTIESVEFTRMVEAGMIIFDNSAFNNFLQAFLSEPGYGSIVNSIQVNLYDRLSIANMPVVLEGQDGEGEEIVTI